MSTPHFDVLIIGAGLSGIGAAFHLKTKCPNKTFAILEGREDLGGTWDLFRYPGIRSDSDMYTLGYSFRPWTSPKAIADGPSILEYVRSTADENDITSKIRFKHKVKSVRWSSEEARWSVEAEHDGAIVRFTAGFVFMCVGYYDYDAGYTPDFPGIEKFQGQVVHPQKWTSDIDYNDKRVVVIGSGATAVTLVPELAKKARQVTMLQRSPTYVVSMPEKDPVAKALRSLPAKASYAIIRAKNIALSMAFFNFCRRYPKRAGKMLVKQAEKLLKGASDVRHFTPSYNPWDQRVCLVPDGDLFRTLRQGRASVVTDHIDTFTETGIRLKSGDELPADLIVTATGLKLLFCGGIELEVDGKRINPADCLTYKGIMLSDVPNLALALGYTNASWTLKCDLTCEYVCRLLNHMDATGKDTCMAARANNVDEVPLLDFTSGYVARALEYMPKQGTVPPWKLRQNYALDMWMIRHTKLEDDAMSFTKRAKTRSVSASASKTNAELSVEGE